MYFAAYGVMEARGVRETQIELKAERANFVIYVRVNCQFLQVVPLGSAFLLLLICRNCSTRLVGILLLDLTPKSSLDSLNIKWKVAQFDE